MSIILKIEKLNYKNILKDLNLTLEEKKFNILIGSNGSGKTTLVKAIVGLIKYSGTITFMDKKINTNALLKNIGVISDFTNLFDCIVIESLLTPLLNLGIKEEIAKKKIYDITKKLDIENLLFKNTNELSFSEQKKVLLTSLVINEPKLIIIDDSLDGLDSLYKKKFLTYISNMNQSTILFITNNSEYFSLADNLIFIKKGKIIEQRDKKNMYIDDKLFIKNGSNLPFAVDLSTKLKSYGLVDNIYDECSELVNKIWK